MAGRRRRRVPMLRPIPAPPPTALPAHPDVTIEFDSARLGRSLSARRVVALPAPVRRRDLRAAERGSCGGGPGQGAAAPIDPTADAVVLIEQFRLPALAAGLDPVMVEIPAGLLDRPGSGPKPPPLRETQEEAGLAVDRAEPIGKVMLTPGGTDELCSMFIGCVKIPATDAAGIAGMAGLPRENEDIRVCGMARQIEAIECSAGGAFSECGDHGGAAVVGGAAGLEGGRSGQDHDRTALRGRCAASLDAGAS